MGHINQFCPKTSRSENLQVTWKWLVVSLNNQTRRSKWAVTHSFNSKSLLLSLFQQIIILSFCINPSNKNWDTKRVIFLMKCYGESLIWSVIDYRCPLMIQQDRQWEVNCIKSSPMQKATILHFKRFLVNFT